MSGIAEFAALMGLRAGEIRNRLRQTLTRSRFRLAVVLVFSVAFWFSLYRIFVLAFVGLRTHMGEFEDLKGTIFYVFFFSLTLMLIFSNGIIAYGSFFRSRETGMLLTLPLRRRTIFFYKYLETLAFSSWAFLFVCLPLMVAFMRTEGLAWTFVAMAMALFAVYMFIPASIGALLALAIANFFPRSKKALLVGLGLAALGVGLIVGLQIVSLKSSYGLSAPIRMAMEILEVVGFTRNPLWPSTWMSKGLLGLAAGHNAAAGFFALVILANAVFLTLAVMHWGETAMVRGWYLVQGARRAKRVRLWRVLDPLIEGALGFLTREVRLIVIKDFKSFIRDPVQSSQFLIFFGLLGLYFLNLRTFNYHGTQMFWKNLVAQLNLLATSLTLATFASRFVFPQVSLEGRRFWVVGMAPMERDKILFGKMALCFLVCLLISETLIGISSIMLQTPARVAVLHAVTLFGICLGVSGMAVGLGAVYPNFREDNPSKIVSGFGGTLNLVVMLAYVVAILIIQAAPCTLFMRHDEFPAAAAWALAAIGALSLAACMIPMAMGLRAIRRLEI